MTKLFGLKWTGGKSAASPRGTGRWIASLLPCEERSLYAEPFFGMGGVLLQRPPVQQEIVNDLDGRVVNWWRVVRDHPEELQRLIALTPKSRREFERALQETETEIDPIRRALNFTIVAQQSLSGGIEAARWAPRYSISRRDSWRTGLDERLSALAERIRDVQIESRDAVELLHRLASLASLASLEHAVLYVDPPYANTYGTAGGYRHNVERGALAEALRAQRGRVAVSGYGGEWDELGWERHERETYASVTSQATTYPRTEVLWTNYAAGREPTLL